MSGVPIVSTGSRELRLAALADELRADAADGAFGAAEADARRFATVRDVAAGLYGLLDVRDESELAAIFARDTAPRTPLIAVAVLFNHQTEGLRLVRDPVAGTVGAPYAFVPPGTDHDTALNRLMERLLPNETALPMPHGVCDSIAAGLAMPHCHFLTYVVDTTLLAPDAIAVPTVSEGDIDAGDVDALTRFVMGGADRDVLEAPFTLTSQAAALLERAAEVATAGLERADDPLRRERFARVADTAGAVLAGARDETAFRTVPFAAMDVVTQPVMARQLILDERDRVLLLRRETARGWSMPGSHCQVGESSAATAIRAADEQLGLDTTIAGLAGVFDQRLAGGTGEATVFGYIGRTIAPGVRPSIAEGITEARPHDPHELSDEDMEPGQYAELVGVLQAAVG